MKIPELENIIIEAANNRAMEEARTRLDSRVKVPKSLGRLEEIAIRLAGITGRAYGNFVDKQGIVLMCADNGVVEEGVASAPQTVTLMQTINFTKKITGVGSQAKFFGIDLLPVDIGVKLPIPEEYLTKDMDSPGDKVVDRRISDGTANFIKEPAMKREEALRGIMIGLEATEAFARKGKTLMGVGEMGIGNTTTASAIIAAVHQVKRPEEKDMVTLLDEIVGRGGGLNDAGLEKKKETIKEGLIKYKDCYINEEGVLDPIGLLSCLGGYEISGMVGAYLGAGVYKIPVVVDGVISIAAALLAAEIEPKIKDYMFTSHRSEEGGYSLAAEILGIEPMYDLGMKLGEGSGCPIAFKIIEAACAVINNMASLEEAQVDSAYLEQLKKEGQFQ